MNNTVTGSISDAGHMAGGSFGFNMHRPGGVDLYDLLCRTLGYPIIDDADPYGVGSMRRFKRAAA